MGFVYQKKQSNAHKMWLTWIELALDCVSLYFSEAVKIIRWDIDKTLCSIIHKIPHVKRFHL